MVKIYYRERLQPEVTQEKQYIEHSLRKYLIQSSHCSLSIESGHIEFPELMCDNKCRLLAVREVHQNLDVQSCY